MCKNDINPAGYRLKFVEYKKAAEKIMGCKLGNFFNEEPHSYNFNSSDENAVMNLQDVGLLDLWFEPIYNINTIKSVPAYESGPYSNLKPGAWYIDSRFDKLLLLYHGNGLASGSFSNGDWQNLISIESWGDTRTLKKASVPDLYTAFERIAKDKGIEKGAVFKSKGENGRMGKIVGNPFYDTDLGTFRAKIQFYGDLMGSESYMQLMSKKGVWNLIEILEPKLDKATWYMDRDNNNVLFYHIKNNRGFGINASGEWVMNREMVSWVRTPLDVETYVKAPNNIVLERLKVYALKKNVIPKSWFNFPMEFSEDQERIMIKDLGCKINSYKTILDVKMLGELFYQDIRLPVINGYKGKMDGNKITYGDCGVLKTGWFMMSDTRGIKKLELTSGVVLEEHHVKDIRRYIRENANPDARSLNEKYFRDEA